MKGRTALWSVLVIGALLHAIVSFPNHWLFRTYALDLGLYTHTAWHYLHGRIHDGTLFRSEAAPMLADHFDLYLVLLCPLLNVFGTWTLLLVQWVSIVVGALGVRQFLLTYGLQERHALSGVAIFLSFFGVFAASAFDYHSNVVASTLMPWFLSALLQRRTLRAACLCMLMVISKENFGLWAGTAALVFAHERTLPVSMKLTTRILGVVAVLWSIMVILFVMPGMSADGRYAHFDYPLLSGIFEAGIGHEHTGPWDILRALFIDLTGAPNGTAIKLEFWIILMLSGGWAFFARPMWGLMALPIVAQKMLHNEPSKWAVFGQYSIEFAPLVAIAVPLMVARWSREGSRSWLLWVAPLLTACCTVRTMDNTVAFHDKSRLRFYQSQHYSRKYDTGLVRAALDRIPPDVAVSAQSPAVPHLALRERLYQFPIIRDADIIILLPQEDPYPLDPVTYLDSIRSLMGDPMWRLEYSDNAMRVFHRSKTPVN